MYKIGPGFGFQYEVLSEYLGKSLEIEVIYSKVALNPCLARLVPTTAGRIHIFHACSTANTLPTRCTLLVHNLTLARQLHFDHLVFHRIKFYLPVIFSWLFNSWFLESTEMNSFPCGFGVFCPLLPTRQTITLSFLN